MNVRRQIYTFISLILLLSILWTIGVTQIAQASTPLPSGKLAQGEVIDNDVFATGQQITIDGTVNGDVIVLGNQVQVNGTVNGSLLVIGQQVVIQGQVAGTTYVAAVSVELGPNASLQRNLYFIGVSLTTQPDSSIQRDLYTICASADLKGSVERSTRATIGIIKIIQWIINALGGEFLPQQSSLLPAVPSGAAGGLVSPLLVPLFQEPAPAGGIDTARLAAWFKDLLREFGLLLILGAVACWIFRNPLNHTAQALRHRPLPALGYGLLALFITINIFLVGILVASLIFVLGLWLGNLGLWGFALGFWALAFGALVGFLASLWFLVAYGTKIIVAYMAGAWLFEKILPNRRVAPFVALALGVLIYSLLRSIPMLGWVLSVLVIAWGLGAAWLAYRKPTAVVQTEPTPAYAPQ